MGQIYKIFVEGFFLCQCYVILKRVKALKLFEKAVKHMSEKESISNGIPTGSAYTWGYFPVSLMGSTQPWP